MFFTLEILTVIMMVMAIGVCLFALWAILYGMGEEWNHCLLRWPIARAMAIAIASWGKSLSKGAGMSACQAIKSFNWRNQCNHVSLFLDASKTCLSNSRRTIWTMPLNWQTAILTPGIKPGYGTTAPGSSCIKCFNTGIYWWAPPERAKRGIPRL